MANLGTTSLSEPSLPYSTLEAPLLQVDLVKVLILPWVGARSRRRVRAPGNQSQIACARAPTHLWGLFPISRAP
jgi:hypothetical protein